MKTLNQFGELMKATSFAFLVMLGCAYFFFAATQGPFGLYEKGRIEADEVMLKARRDVLSARRVEAQNKVARLSDNFLDLDLLDEQARKVLGYARSDEILIK